MIPRATVAPPMIVFRNRRAGMRARRVVDVVIASLALVLSLPVLTVAAAAILIEDGAPVLFCQRRVGRYERTFTIYKLRSMRRSACGDARTPNSSRDARISTVGRFIRRTSIDELPQLFNVFLGHMSLVGPRPALPDEADKYAEHVRRRLVVKPGLTGLWQVSGRSDLSWEESVRLDLRYVENWSFALDLQIMWKTISVLVRGSGAY
jgi:lipopolysaccharide/colanic/teichoic acid biosynthesis glycosyltransferase